MSTVAQKSTAKRERSYAHKVQGNYWKGYLEQAHSGCTELRRHLENLHRMPMGDRVAQECLGISLDVTQIAEAVRALAQIGSSNA